MLKVPVDKNYVYPLREGRSNAHVKGDYQRIGDVMLRNMCALKVKSSSPGRIILTIYDCV